jgi:hypothetical protein
MDRLHLRLARLLVLVLGAAIARGGIGVARAADVDVAVERYAGTVRIEGDAVLHAELAQAWAVLTDYDRYNRFVPGVRSSRVIARRGSSVTVEQSGDAGLWPLRSPIRVVYEIVERAPTELRSRVIAGCDCTLESTYSLMPFGSGVRLSYTGQLAGGESFRAALEQAAVERRIAAHLQALAEQIERESVRIHSSAPSDSATAKPKR